MVYYGVGGSRKIAIFVTSFMNSPKVLKQVIKSSLIFTKVNHKEKFGSIFIQINSFHNFSFREMMTALIVYGKFVKKVKC